MNNLKAIFATDSVGGIGNRGTLPWPKNTEDFAWFKEHTTDHIVVMGHNTWKDPKFPKPLKDRINVVISKSSIDDARARFVHPDNLLNTLESVKLSFPEKETFVIGGKQVLEWLRPDITTIYLTRFKGKFYSDTRIDIESFLYGYRLMSVKPGTTCTFERWEKIIL
jgi:dihydrofolate reductase